MPRVTWFTGKIKPSPALGELELTGLKTDTDAVFIYNPGKIATLLIAASILIFNFNLFIIIITILTLNYSWNRNQLKKSGKI